MTQQERLRAYIRKTGMTQGRFAERIGVSRETISRLVTGALPISGAFVGDFFLAFGADATAEVFGPQPAQPISADGLSNADAAG